MTDGQIYVTLSGKNVAKSKDSSPPLDTPTVPIPPGNTKSCDINQSMASWMQSKMILVLKIANMFHQ